MKGLDTNVLLRYFVADDSSQAVRAARFIKNNCTRETPGFINRIVLCELVWVLESAYGYARAEIVRLLEMMLRTAEFTVEDQAAAWAASRHFAAGRCDFADALLALTNERAGCGSTVTFDRKATALAQFEPLK